MNENKGAKGGARDRRLLKFFLSLLNIAFYKEEDDKQKKKNDELDKKNKNVIKNTSKLGVANDLKKDTITDNRMSKNNIIGKQHIPVEIPDDINVDEVIVEFNLNHEKVKKESKLDDTNNKELYNYNLDNSKNDVEDNVEHNIANDNYLDNNSREKQPVIFPIPLVDSTKNKNEAVIKDKNNSKEKPKLDNPIFVDEKEIVLEKKIIDELENIIEDDRYKLNKLIAEYNIINKETDDLIRYDDAEQANIEVEKILDKLNKIKDELENLIKSNNFDLVYSFDDNYISYLLNTYKNNFNTDFTEKEVEEIKTNKKYNSIMSKIIELENETSKLENKIADKMNEFGMRDDDLYKVKNSVDNMDSSISSLDYSIYNMDSIVKDIEDKVNNCVSITKKVEYIQKEANNQLSNLLLTFALTKNNPLIPNGVGLLLRGNAIMKYLISLFSSNLEKKVHIEIDVKDYSEEINDALNDINKLNSTLNDSLQLVKKTKSSFEKEFSKYISDLPECKEIYEKLNKLEKDVNYKVDQINRSSKELDYQLIANKQKQLKKNS